ncbi:MAG: cyclic nucleotide-binding domain-containing protein [Roseateles sp.]|nr:MAG: cyclic nucleotide-binding domain-containing protein [Roseateles sp.]
MIDHLATALGLLGAALMLASYLMKSMLPLRIAALTACCFLVAYGALKQALPTLLLYGALIPINVKKTLQMRRLVQSIARAKADTPVSEWLLPHMHRRTVAAGTTLWRKGDVATEMLYVEGAGLRLAEYGEAVAPGSLIGEIGLFAPDKRRTLTLEAVGDCVVYSLTAEEMALLYYQNPKLGFHVMRLIVARLMRDAARPHEGAPAEAG